MQWAERAEMAITLFQSFKDPSYVGIKKSISLVLDGIDEMLILNAQGNGRSFVTVIRYLLL